MENKELNYPEKVRPDVINFDDVCEAMPAMAKHPRLVKWLLHFLRVDEVNRVHGTFCDTPGPQFVRRMLTEDFKITVKVDNEQVLDHLPEGAFITVSNHPFGALDGIILIDLIASRRPKFKVMVNMILNKISAMRPNFIAVDAMASKDPEKQKVSVHGIKEALSNLRDGEPVGFFPAGAMSKINWDMKLYDEPWRDSVLRLIYKAKVPVIPIFFHGSNSAFFNALGRIWWVARTLRLPREVFRKRGSTIQVSIGDPISVEEQAKFDSPQALGAYLREKTYELRDKYE